MLYSCCICGTSLYIHPTYNTFVSNEGIGYIKSVINNTFVPSYPILYFKKTHISIYIHCLRCDLPYTELPRTKPANAVARSVRTGVGSAETAIQITYAHVRARGEMHINASAC